MQVWVVPAFPIAPGNGQSLPQGCGRFVELPPPTMKVGLNPQIIGQAEFGSRGIQITDSLADLADAFLKRALFGARPAKENRGPSPVIAEAVFDACFERGLRSLAELTRLPAELV
jgi:hypothetical protein